MPPTLTYPGVYIEELPSGVHPITGVATSITAFVGRALRGPVDEPITITSFADFERIFGGALAREQPRLRRPGLLPERRHRSRSSCASTRRKRQPTPRRSRSAAATGRSPCWPPRRAPGARSSRRRSTTTSPTRPTRTLFNLTVTDTGTGKIESFRNVSFATGSARRFDLVLVNQSTLVRPDAARCRRSRSPRSRRRRPPPAAATATRSTRRCSPAALSAPTRRASTPSRRPTSSTCSSSRRTRAGGEIDSSVLTDTIAYAVERRAMMIIDPPAAWTSARQRRHRRGRRSLRSTNAAVYFPRIQEPDPLRDGQIVTFAPSRRGRRRHGPHRRDARRLEGAGRARGDARRRAGARASPLDRPRERQAQPARRQLPAQLPGRPASSSGARARCDGADRLASEWKYVPVRRTALFLEESLYRGTQWVVFEPNDEPLWAQIRLNVGAFMHDALPPGRLPGHDAAARPTSSSATTRRRRRTTSTSASSTSWSASRR